MQAKDPVLQTQNQHTNPLAPGFQQKNSSSVGRQVSASTQLALEGQTAFVTTLHRKAMMPRMSYGLIAPCDTAEV